MISEVNSLDMNPGEFKELQSKCESLAEICRLIDNGKTMPKEPHTYEFVLRDGFIYKHILTSKHANEVGKDKLVVPSACRLTILKLSHDLPVAGYFSPRKILRIKHSIRRPD